MKTKTLGNMAHLFLFEYDAIGRILTKTATGVPVYENNCGLYGPIRINTTIWIGRILRKMSICHPYPLQRHGRLTYRQTRTRTMKTHIPYNDTGKTYRKGCASMHTRAHIKAQTYVRAEVIHTFIAAENMSERHAHSRNITNRMVCYSYLESTWRPHSCNHLAIC